MTVQAKTRLSVVVPTRDRPAELARCVASILRCDHDSFELLVVDQTDRQTVTLASHERLRVIPSGTVGKSAALNVGVRAARGEVLVFTDDDCTVPPQWLSQVESLIQSHNVDLIFGNLIPIKHDSSKMFIPQTRWNNLCIVRGKRRAYLRGGAGGNLVVVARVRCHRMVGRSHWPWESFQSM